ncbi:MAG TPA: molybdate ABC transporter substrate-binding protein [Gaiellaceae bacterium]|nr:molybdate ABC transporter substrate-binding protein [Gaiellaceae bacterium]
MSRGLVFGAALAVVIALVAGFTSARSEGPATVYAAASLTDVLAKVSPSSRFQFAGSNQLALQISRGAPADAFASASPVYTQGLFRDGLVEKPRTFATNSLVLAVPRSNPAKIRSVFDLAKRPKLKLVVAGQKVPIGLYTREVLKRLALLRVLRKAVSQEPDVKGIVGKLALGEADVGFVYATDVRTASSRLLAIPLPKRSQPTVRYEVAVVKGSKNREAALELVADLLSTDGRRELRKAGFGLP